MRTMYDSTKAADIPDGSDLVMGYVDGSFAWSAADWQRFPGQKLVRACIFNNRMDAQVIDIEENNNNAIGAVPWIKAKWERGETPTVYCYTDLGPASYRVKDVKQACDLAGVKYPLFLVAHYDGVVEIPDGCIGKQYANPNFTGGHYDASAVADYWPGVDNMITLAEQSSDLVLTVGEVGSLTAGFSYNGGPVQFVQRKVYAPNTPGRYIEVLRAPADPAADATEVLDAPTATFVIDVHR